MKNNECFIDAHCHLDMCKDIDKIIENAKKVNVNIIVTQGVNPKSNREVLKYKDKYNIVKAALGLYPIDALSLTNKEVEKEIEFIKSNGDKIVAIGEVGLDFKEDNENHQKQKNIFQKLIELSIDLDKPIIVHSRKAELECIEILEKSGAKKVIMHCFCGKFSLIERIAKNGWYLTIPTSVKNAEHFQKMIKMVEIKQLLCETDSPFLHPDKMPNNEPANVLASYKKIAEIKGISLEEAKKKVFENFKRVFVEFK
jgi:TatD DNase family protein